MFLFLSSIMSQNTHSVRKFFENKYNFCLFFLKGLSPWEKFMTCINGKVMPTFVCKYLPMLLRKLLFIMSYINLTSCLLRLSLEIIFCGCTKRMKKINSRVIWDSLIEQVLYLIHYSCNWFFKTLYTFNDHECSKKTFSKVMHFKKLRFLN